MGEGCGVLHVKCDMGRKLRFSVSARSPFCERAGRSPALIGLKSLRFQLRADARSLTIESDCVVRVRLLTSAAHFPTPFPPPARGRGRMYIGRLPRVAVAAQPYPGLH